MLNIAAAGWLVGIAAMGSVGAVATGVVPIGSQPDSSVVTEAEPVNQMSSQPSALPSEVLAQVPLVQRVTLGPGDHLDASITKAVKQMDPQLSDDQAHGVVLTLLDSVKTDAAGADLDALPPGVSVLVLRQMSEHGAPVWSVYVGKNSGIVQR